MDKKIIPITLLVLSLVLPFFNFNNAYAEIIIYQITTNATDSIGNSSSSNLCSNGNDIRKLLGEEVTSTSSLIGKTFDKIAFDVQRGFDVPGQTGYVGVWDSTITPTSSNYIRLFGTFSASSLPAGSFTTLTFTSFDYIITSNDVIGVFYECNGAFDFIELKTSGTNQFNGTNTAMTDYRFTNSWIDTGTRDVGLTLSLMQQDLPNPTGGINCNDPANANILVCRLGGSGAIGATGNFVIGNTTKGTGIAGISCTVGIVDCVSNPDIKTNGLGYIFLAITLGVYIGILFIASRGLVTDIPNFVWITGLIAIVGFATILKWIDPTIFIVIIIVIIALAGIRSKNIFSGAGGMFKGEES